MWLQFGNPLWLLALIPLGLHLFWMGRRLQLLSRRRRGAALAIRATIIILLVLSLAGMRLALQSNDLTVLYVVDASDSLPEKQRQLGRAFVQKTLAEMGPDDQAGVIIFGSDAALEHAPSPTTELGEIQSVVDTSRSDLAGAIQLAMACFVGETQRRVVVVSDGNQNIGDAEDAARAAAAAQIAIDVVALKYENRSDIIVEKVLVEDRVSIDEPFDLRVIATSRERTTGQLAIYQDGALLTRQPVELLPGKKNVFQFPTQVRDSRFHTFEVQLDAEGDSIPENNRAHAFTYAKGEPLVLLVDGDSPPSQALAAMLRSEQINVDLVDPNGLSHSLRDLQAYDSVIFNNVAAADITSPQMRMIERAVHDLGVGFIMIGGENSFGAGGYNDSPIETVLPVTMELKNEKILPQGALVPIIHTVEIPQGQFWAEQVAIAALDVLSARDLMGVLYYDWQRQDSWLFPLQEVGNKARLRNLITGIQAGDMPSFDTTLQMAYVALVGSGASVKHIVVISDGDPQTPNPALAKKIRDAHITISTVCINPHSPRDPAVMADLARMGGGNFYEPQNYNVLPQIFIKEATTVRKSLLIEEPFTPAIKQYSAVLVGLGEVYPTLNGYVATGPKGLADLPLVTHKGDPLLAHWRHGVGKTVAFTSDAKERWANDWLGWNEFAKFWAQIVRWTLRTPFNPDYQMEMTVDGAEGKIVVDAVTPDGEFRNFLNVGGRVISPSNNAQDVEFRQTAPGRYEASFDVNEPGAYMLGAQAAAGAEAGADLITGGTALSYSPEFVNSRSNEALLYRMSDLTGGRALEPTSSVFLHNLAGHAEPIDLWPRLLKFALALFLLDVFLRRVIVGWAEIAAAFGIAWNWIVAKIWVRRLATAGATNRLLEVKQEATSARPRTPEAREEFLASLESVRMQTERLTDTASRETERRKARLKSLKKPKQDEQTEEPVGDAYTSQLLQARSRAKHRRGGTPKPRKEDES